jgi:two-component system KDP operon response regulator KdpE
MKVLLVEDEAALADVIRRNLRARGFEVSVADSAEAALLAMTASSPDVLVLDVNLPDMTGWDILRGLGAAGRERLPAIVVSAAPISQKRIDEFRPFRTLTKPFPIEALVRALEAAKEAKELRAGGEAHG